MAKFLQDKLKHTCTVFFEAVVCKEEYLHYLQILLPEKTICAARQYLFHNRPFKSNPI